MKNSKFVVSQGRWTHREKYLFNQAISNKKLCWSEIAEIVGTRTKEQCRSHYQKLKISNRIQEIKAGKQPSQAVIKEKIEFSEKETQCLNFSQNCKSPVNENQNFFVFQATSTEKTEEFEIFDSNCSSFTTNFNDYDDEALGLLMF